MLFGCGVMIVSEWIDVLIYIVLIHSIHPIWNPMGLKLEVRDSSGVLILRRDNKSELCGIQVEVN